MQSYNIEESASKPAVYAQLATITKWAKMRSKLSLAIKNAFVITPYKQKVFSEVAAFWNQEIYWNKGLHIRPLVKKDIFQDNQPIVEFHQNEEPIMNFGNEISIDSIVDVPEQYFND